MANSANHKATRSWRIKHPYLTDDSGRPEYYRGQAPSFHGLIYFVGASGAARIVLTTAQPTTVWVYTAVYIGCVLAALGIGVFVRAKERNDENFGRKLSAGFGLMNLVPGSVMSTLSIHTATQPAVAGIAPLAAGVAMVLGTLITTKLPDWFPDPDAQPKPKPKPGKSSSP